MTYSGHGTTQLGGLPTRDRMARPAWALAYVLTAWKRDRHVAKAYKLAADEDTNDLWGEPSEETWEAVRAARDKLRTFTAALDEVLDRWGK